MRTPDRTCALLYLSSQCQVQLYIYRIAAHKVRATWINPHDGAEQAGGTYETGNDVPGQTFPQWTKQWFAVPDFWEDAVLLLEGVTAH